MLCHHSIMVDEIIQRGKKHIGYNLAQNNHCAALQYRPNEFALYCGT